MYKKLESFATALLGLLVPKVDAAAACRWVYKDFPHCMGCPGLGPCRAKCAVGCGCIPGSEVCY